MMKRGADGQWRTYGGVVISKKQQEELTLKGRAGSGGETIHKLYIVHPKSAVYDIVERECRIVITGKITWAEPLMPLRGTARYQKRFMLGAFAFYTRQQAERKKLIMLAALLKAPAHGQTFTLHHEAFKQLEHFKLTGEVK